MGPGPYAAYAAEGSQCRKGIARLKPRDARVGAAPSGRSPGRARSPLGWGPAPVQPARPKARQAAWAPPGRSRAAQERVQPLPTGRSLGQAGSPLGWGPANSQPARPKARHSAKASPAPPPAGKGPGWEPTRVGSGPGSACAAKGAPDCMGVAWPKPSDSGEGTASSRPGEARVGSGAHSGGVLPRFSLRC